MPDYWFVKFTTEALQSYLIEGFLFTVGTLLSVKSSLKRYINKISMDAQGRVGFALYIPVWNSVNAGFSNRIFDTDWHYIAMTYDGSVMKRYLDGLFRISISNSGNLQSSVSDIYIGRQGTITP